MAQQDHYIEVKAIQFPGMTARVFRPVLAEEERKARMNAIHMQAARFIKSIEAQRREEAISSMVKSPHGNSES